MNGRPAIDYEALARRMEGNPPARRYRTPDNETCDVCGGWKGGWAPVHGRFCSCERLVERGFAQLATVDPEDEMGFDTLERVHPTLGRAARLVQGASLGEPGRGVAMFGKPGIGKTHLAVAACREALQRGVLAGYYNVAGLVSRIQETYSPYEEETRRAVIEGVARRRFVVLDDLGKEHRSANVDSIIYELVNALYITRATPILCSNLPDVEYRGRYDEAVRSRIAGMCEIVVVAGEDRRRQ
ncbi:MAG: ATP-binding protein [Rubrobacteraceae bacterium]